MTPSERVTNLANAISNGMNCIAHLRSLRAAPPTATVEDLEAWRDTLAQCFRRPTCWIAGGCVAALLVTGCSTNVYVGGAGGGSGVTITTASAGSGSGGAGGALPGACQPPAPAAEPPGMYGIVDQTGMGKSFAFFKRDDANDRCMILYVRSGLGPAYGVDLGGYGIEKIILTNSAMDCQYVFPFPTPAGEVAEASCGTGTFQLEPAEGAIVGQIAHATFAFSPAYSWVPASDTYCVVDNCCATPPVPGC
jgi:hypothetical protein